jgi:hypothetical protein
LEGFYDLCAGFFQIAKDQTLLSAGLDAGGDKTPRKPLLTEVTFFDDSLRPGRKLQVDLFDERPGIFPVKASRSIRATRHAVAASDAAVKIHHHDAVFSLPGGPGRTVLYTGGVFAVIAEKGHGIDPVILGREFERMFRKYLVIRDGPDPFDLFFAVAEIGNIVDSMAGVDAIPASCVYPTLL